jgi:hypothetical protein
MPTQTTTMNTRKQAVQKLKLAWPYIVTECRQVLGSELHYQAIVYHCLRLYGEVPLSQIGMNVKIGIIGPTSELLKKLDAKRHLDYQGMVEPIPDVCLFSSKVGSDWRRRNHDKTLVTLLLAIELKASERKNGRLRSGEIISDIEKLAAHCQEAKARDAGFIPVVMVIDTAPDESERMLLTSRDLAMAKAKELSVGFMYLSPTEEFSILPRV